MIWCAFIRVPKAYHSKKKQIINRHGKVQFNEGKALIVDHLKAGWCLVSAGSIKRITDVEANWKNKCRCAVLKKNDRSIPCFAQKSSAPTALLSTHAWLQLRIALPSHRPHAGLVPQNCCAVRRYWWSLVLSACSVRAQKVQDGTGQQQTLRDQDVYLAAPLNVRWSTVLWGDQWNWPKSHGHKSYMM